MALKNYKWITKLLVPKKMYIKKKFFAYKMVLKGMES
jgi:hypothetical protein